MSSISAGKLVANAMVHLSDRTGELVFKTNGTTTALTLDSAQNATFAGDVDVAGNVDITGALTVTGNLTVAGTTTSFGDNDKIVLGDGQDLQIYHDGSNSIIHDNGTGNLNIRADDFNILNAGATETKISASSNGAVVLYFDNSAKISTTGTGADVTGELIADSYNETYAAVTSTSNATTVNCEAGNTFMHTLTENTTFTFSNPPASGTGYTMTVEIIQDASASGYTVTWPTSVDWPSATAPTLTATASAIDVFVFTTRDGGTTWYGFTAGQGIATPA